jgi:hypothetical protein
MVSCVVLLGVVGRTKSPSFIWSPVSSWSRRPSPLHASVIMETVVAMKNG